MKKFYFTECWWATTDGPSTDPRHTVGTNHRMLSTYFNAFVRARLTPEAVCEPRTRSRMADARS